MDRYLVKHRDDFTFAYTDLYVLHIYIPLLASVLCHVTASRIKGKIVPVLD
jgi:hypothetical protein